MDDEVDPTVFAEMKRAFFSEEVQRSIEVIKRAAHHDIGDGLTKPFTAFHAYITNPEPTFITIWRSDPKGERRYHQLVNGVLGNVRGALGAVTYHHNNLGQIEAEIRAGLSQIDFRSALKNSTIGLGGTQKLDIEYQSYVIAYRRCLDYLTYALSAYFGRSSHSFRRMDKGLARVREVAVSQALLEVRGRYEDAFRFVMGVEGNISLRDRISHKEFVGAGCFNLTPFGVSLVGGGEDLAPQYDANQSPLSAALNSRTENLFTCISDMLEAFEAATRAETANPKPSNS